MGSYSTILSGLKQKNETQTDYTDAPFDRMLWENTFRDIFSPPNIEETINHVLGHISLPFFALSADDLDAVNSLAETIKANAKDDAGVQDSYSASENNYSLTITKASDFTSTDYHESYNKVSVLVNNIAFEWYFRLTDDQPEVEEDRIFNKPVLNGKRELMYEKNEANKVDGFNRNNTGYKFWWSDGSRMNHGDVENFINRKRALGDKRFLDDFPVVKEGGTAPSYTIEGRKQPYYAYDKRLSDPYEDENNLQSAILAGVYELEQAFDGHIFIGTSSKGEPVNRIKQALNRIYLPDKSFTPLVENGNYDAATIAAVKRFQTDNQLKSKNGIVGDETLRLLDTKLLGMEVTAAKDDQHSEDEDALRKLKRDAYLDWVKRRYPGDNQKLKEATDWADWAYENGMDFPEVSDLDNAVNENEFEYGAFYYGTFIPFQVYRNQLDLGLLPDGFIPWDDNSWKPYGTYSELVPEDRSYRPKTDKEGNYIEKETLHNKFFQANDKITTTNVSTIIMAGFINGSGPENYVFYSDHEVSKAMSRAYIVQDKIWKWYDDNYDAIENGGELKGLDEFSGFGKGDQALNAWAWTNGSVFSIENLVGSAHVTISPNAKTNTLNITVYNVTSKGSGHYEKDLPSWTGMKESEAHSFPRNPNGGNNQMFSNVSQTFYIEVPYSKETAEFIHKLKNPK